MSFKKHKSKLQEAKMKLEETLPKVTIAAESLMKEATALKDAAANKFESTLSAVADEARELKDTAVEHAEKIAKEVIDIMQLDDLKTDKSIKEGYKAIKCAEEAMTSKLKEILDGKISIYELPYRGYKNAIVSVFEKIFDKLSIKIGIDQISKDEYIESLAEFVRKNVKELGEIICDENEQDPIVSAVLEPAQEESTAQDSGAIYTAAEANVLHDQKDAEAEL